MTNCCFINWVTGGQLGWFGLHADNNYDKCGNCNDFILCCRLDEEVVLVLLLKLIAV